MSIIREVPTFELTVPVIVIGAGACGLTAALAVVKAEPRLKDMALVKFSRLSVQPVTAAEWKIVCKMGGMRL